MNVNQCTRALLPALFAGLLSLSGCVDAAYHRAAVNDARTDRVTVGTVQKEIRTGMSGAEVVAALGAPNIVTTDEARREVWVYDKVASEVVASGGSLKLTPFGLLTGGSGLVGGSGGIAQGASATSRTDRTLTIVIKFDEHARVRDFAYHATQF